MTKSGVPEQGAVQPEDYVSQEIGQGPQVEILLATYNGERYLEQQMESLLQQAYAGMRILARDDGSSDATPEILRRLEEKYPDRLRVLADNSPSGSPKNNFARLMEASSAPYIMFSDQDDVWDLDKVGVSMAAMQTLEERHGPTVPLMVYTDLKVVDADLAVQHASFWKQQNMDPDGVHHLPSLLCRNVVAGCTALINRPLLRLALPVPQEAYMHDWWISLLACVFGNSACLRRATLSYRQHGGNSVGAAEQRAPNLMPRWNDHQARQGMWNQSYEMAQTLWQQHGATMPASPRKIVNAFLRCNDSPNRWERVTTLIRYRFFLRGIRPKLAVLWYLWNKDSIPHQIS